MGHTCNPNTSKVETGGLGVQSHPLLHSEFKVNLGNTVTPCLKTKILQTQVSSSAKEKY